MANVLVCIIPELGRPLASLRMLFALSSSSLALDVIHAVVAPPRLLSLPAEIAFKVLCILSRSTSSVFCDFSRPPIQVKFPVFLIMKTRRLGRDAAMMTDAGSTIFQIARSTLVSSTQRLVLELCKCVTPEYEHTSPIAVRYSVCVNRPNDRNDSRTSEVSRRASWW